MHVLELKPPYSVRGEPSLLRVIPVNVSHEARPQVTLYEDLDRMIGKSRSFKVSDCVCRRERRIEGRACKHTVENCLAISPEERAFDYFPVPGRIISREEAIKVLSRAEEEGLVHCSWNIQRGHSFICNCCSCSWAIMRGLKEFHAPYILAKSNFVAGIDPGSCASCGVCKEERCPMDAIAETYGSYKVLKTAALVAGFVPLPVRQDL